ncbi:hypothetical protein ABZ840_27490 [Streptomyces sp. NPDC047117]|uniref:hypothetical protein n=2 Tax=unclassified Streptomyces TaxID=2593676 RepID=UPI0033E5C21D
MHPYDPSPRAPFHSIPGMRPSYEPAAHHLDRGSATPIYDALYAEYRRSFRALPGDRTGEDELSPEVLRRIWRRTTPAATGRREVPLPPQHSRSHTPAALPPAPRDHRPYHH